MSTGLISDFGIISTTALIILCAACSHFKTIPTIAIFTFRSWFFRIDTKVGANIISIDIRTPYGVNRVPVYCYSAFPWFSRRTLLTRWMYATHEEAHNVFSSRIFMLTRVACSVRHVFYYCLNSRRNFYCLHKIQSSIGILLKWKCEERVLFARNFNLVLEHWSIVGMKVGGANQHKQYRLLGWACHVTVATNPAQRVRKVNPVRWYAGVAERDDASGHNQLVPIQWSAPNAIF